MFPAGPLPPGHREAYAHGIVYSHTRGGGIEGGFCASLFKPVAKLRGVIGVNSKPPIVCLQSFPVPRIIVAYQAVSVPKGAKVPIVGR